MPFDLVEVTHYSFCLLYTENETEERQQFPQGNMACKDMNQEKSKELDKKKEEEEDFSAVIDVLNVERKELEISKDKLRSQLEKMAKGRDKNKKKLEKIEKRFSWDNDHKRTSLLLVKQDLEKKKEDYQSTLHGIMERLNKMENVITRMTERKMEVEEQLKRIDHSEK